MIDSSAISLIAIRALIAIGAAAVGGLLGMARRRGSHRMLCALVSLAAGALLAVTVKSIVPETIELLGGLTPALASIAGGVLIFAGITRYVYFLCPACAASATEDGSGFLRLGVLMMVAMGIHSTIDGLAISAGSAAAHSHESAAGVGLLILFAVSYHKVPEGMALVSLARLAGYGRAKALGITLLIELTTAVGAFAGIFFMNGISALWLGITLGVVAGSFIYTVGFALLREMYEHEKGSIILYSALGFASILALAAILANFGIGGHEH